MSPDRGASGQPEASRGFASLKRRVRCFTAWVVVGAALILLEWPQLPFVGGFVVLAWVLAGGALTAALANDMVLGPRVWAPLGVLILVVVAAVAAFAWNSELQTRQLPSSGTRAP